MLKKGKPTKLICADYMKSQKVNFLRFPNLFFLPFPNLKKSTFCVFEIKTKKHLVFETLNINISAFSNLQIFNKGLRVQQIKDQLLHVQDLKKNPFFL